MRKTASIAAGLALCVSLLGAGAAFAGEAPPQPLPEPGPGDAGATWKLEPGWPRLAGNTALDTMAAIVSTGRGWAEQGGTVVVATDESWHDALSAAPLAGREGAPVLLSHRDGVPEQTLAQLDRLRPSKVIVVGGEAAVSEAAAAQIAGRSGAELRRVFGQDAAETSVAVSRELGHGGRKVLVATASTFQDALAAAPYAYANGCPVLLTGPDGSLSDAALAEVAGRWVVIMGGREAVPESVESQLGGRPLTRAGGVDSVDTSRLFAQWALANGSSRSGMGVATASSWYDALTGAALCGRCGSVLLLATDYDTSAVLGVASASWGTPDWKECDGWIFGGPAALSTEAMMATPGSKRTEVG